MVLVSLCWYLDQQVVATGGVWKVPTIATSATVRANPVIFKPPSSLFTFVLVQGSEAVRPLPPPEELVFTVDEKVRGDISLAKQRYLESVSKR